jgi:hypothetical protein
MMTNPYVYQTVLDTNKNFSSNVFKIVMQWKGNL